MYVISHLVIYPVKSLGGIEVASAQLTDRGFQYDRRWMLVDNNNRFLTQRECSQMSQLQTAIENDQLVIHHKQNVADKLFLSLQPSPATAIQVKVWDDLCTVQYVSNAADKWLSKKLLIKCRLVYMPDSEKRKVDERYAKKNEITSLSDGYPLLMIGQASLDDLNSRLKDPVKMDRFRPNIVFTGGRAYDEDIMGHVVINKIDLYGVKLCARCAITTINQRNAAKGKEPLRTLACYRMKKNKVYFGQNILYDQSGLLRVGDHIRVLKTKAPLLFNNPAVYKSNGFV